VMVPLVCRRRTRVLKEAGVLAAEIVGFPKFKRDKHGDIVPGSVQATGKNGLVGYLMYVALIEPRAYLGFLGRLLPLQINAHLDGHQQPCDLAIAVAAVLLGKLDSIGGETLFTAARGLALRRAMLPERRAGATLGDMQLRSHLLNQARRRAGLRSFPGRPPAEFCRH
jgi:hypothetical protein